MPNVPTPPPPVYAHLAQIRDPAIRGAVQAAFSLLNDLLGRGTTIPTLNNGLMAGGQRVQLVGDPTADQDAVTKKYAEAHFGPDAIRRALGLGGSYQLNVQNLPGLPSGGSTGGVILYMTHAERLLLDITTLQDGTAVWENDREALYQVQLIGGVNTWTPLMTRPNRDGSLYGDLGTEDAGFATFISVDGYTARWSGSNWNYYLGSLVNTFANRPNLALADRGFLFIASDRGYQTWRKMDVPNDWLLMEGVGGPMVGTLSPDQKPTLGANDAGFRFASSDFDRVYRWTGAAWADAPGQPARGTIAYFDDTLLPGTGWALCDGGAVTRSTSTGTTAAFTTPNLTGANRFLRSVAGATGGVGGSATTHFHPVNPPITATSAPTATVAVQSGAGTTVATDTHTHNVDISSFSSGAPSGAGGDDALPPYLNARPYIRL